MSGQVQYSLESALGGSVGLPVWVSNGPGPIPYAPVTYPTGYSVQWSASAGITPGVPAHVQLGVGPYQNTVNITTSFTGSAVLATSDSSESWYLIPTGTNGNFFWISFESGGQDVWTVQDGNQTIGLAPSVNNSPNQQFKFSPAQ